jgi:alpha-L-fucosidase
MTIPFPLSRIARFEELAYGMFIHWGLYSQLGKGEWIQHLENIPLETYDELEKTFTAAEFDGRAIARLARESGMKYIVLTTRHHEGFSLYDTRGLSEHDALHAPAGRDLVAEFVDGCRAEGIIPFFYHTTLDWRWQSQRCDDRKFDEYLDYLLASVEILCTQYGPIGGLWFDGNWSRRGAEWKEDRLYAMIRSHQPEAMIINNTGIGSEGKLGHPEIDSVTFEQSLPKPMNRNGWPKYISGEMCQTMNAHWGIGAMDFAYKSPADIIQNLAHCRRAGANYLLNVGPTGSGRIPEYETAALRRSGQWVAMHADPVYKGKPTRFVCQGRDFILEVNGTLYYFVFDLAISGHGSVTVGQGGTGPRAIRNLDRPVLRARWMDNGEELKFTQNTGAGLAAIDFTGYPYGTNLVVRVAEIDTGC